MYIWHDVDPVDLDHLSAGGAQRRMQHGPVLGDIDPITTKHGVTAGGYTRHLGLRQQARQQFVVDRLLRIIDPQVTGDHHIATSAGRVGFKQVGERAFGGVGHSVETSGG